jgi:hypothetical protein
MASDMMTGKGGRRSGIDRRSKFFTPYMEFTYRPNEDLMTKEGADLTGDKRSA